MRYLLVVLAAASLTLGASVAPPAKADPTCTFLGTNYPVQYDCTQNQPWLPYGTPGNPPAGGGMPGTSCAPPRQHDIGC